jgi:hypothetical protein
VRSELRDGVIRTWTTRVGPEAAERYAAAVVSYIDLAWTMLVGFGLAIIGGLLHAPPLWIAGLCVLSAFCVLLVRSFLIWRQFHERASESLGIHVRLSPPQQERLWVRWCEKRGIPPHQFAANGADTPPTTRG